VMSCIEGLGKEQRIMALNVDMLQKELQQVWNPPQIVLKKLV
jgi:hypothetical protein